MRRPAHCPRERSGTRIRHTVPAFARGQQAAGAVPDCVPATQHPDTHMHYFLIRQNNELQHLPQFRLIAPAKASGADGDADGASTASNGIKPAHFVCPLGTTELPMAFLVVDEDAIVRACNGRMLRTGKADFILSGTITDEYEAPYRNQALDGIRAALSAISE